MKIPCIEVPRHGMALPASLAAAGDGAEAEAGR